MLMAFGAAFEIKIICSFMPSLVILEDSRGIHTQPVYKYKWYTGISLLRLILNVALEKTPKIPCTRKRSFHSIYRGLLPTHIIPRPGSVVVERSPGMREVGGSIPGCVKQKTLKFEVLLLCLALST